LGSEKKILVAPLDWGLGHAARCVPIIRELLAKNVEVILGGSGLSGKFLQTEFPQLSYEEIPGYKVSYSTKLPMSIAMLRQAPGILRAIQQEKKWLEEKVEKEKPDAIISDHRYGLYHKDVYSVFVGHQLFISSGNNDLLEPVLWKVNKSYISHFDHCWIPDLPGEPNASGKLSHKSELPFAHSFIGLISRLFPNVQDKKEYKAGFILSGLEPLRTELENLLVDQSFDLPAGKYILVRGTQQPIKKALPENMDCIDLVNTAEIERIIQASEIIISRAGYSSIMDYIVCKTQALLIPTPGQTEQEYLAKYHLESGNFYSVEQNKLDLNRDLKLAFSYQPQFTINANLLSAAIENLLNTA
jgi:UDP-N-acetylglucosamine transferase subunit ALG13